LNSTNQTKSVEKMRARKARITMASYNDLVYPKIVRFDVSDWSTEFLVEHRDNIPEPAAWAQ
jgi:hypothetical protein